MLELVDTLKICSKCKVGKPTSEFHKDKSAKTGLRYNCKECCNKFRVEYVKNNKETIAATSKRYIDKHKNTPRYKAARRDEVLRRNYGINLDTYNQMFADQEGKCKICDTHQSEMTKAMAVDHCHITNKVRGLLCIKCNTGIGQLGDDIDMLQAAIKYLKEYK